MKQFYFLATIVLLVCLVFPAGKLVAQSGTEGMPQPPADATPASMKMYEAKKLRWTIAHPEEYKAMQQAQGGSETNKEIAPASFPKFLSYPTSRQMPLKIESGNASEDQLLYDLRVQHWYFLFDQEGYKAKYGPLPTNLPGGISAKEYAKNPPSRAISTDLERKFAEMQSAESEPAMTE